MLRNCIIAVNYTKNGSCALWKYPKFPIYSSNKAEERLEEGGPVVTQETMSPHSSLTLVLPHRDVRVRIERGKYTLLSIMEETGHNWPDEMV